MLASYILRKAIATETRDTAAEIRDTAAETRDIGAETKTISACLQCDHS